MRLSAPFRRLAESIGLRRSTTGDDSTRSTDDGTGIQRRRLHADRDGSFVVFQVGMRINVFWKVHRWLPIFLTAPRLADELEADPDSGLLGSRAAVGPGLRHFSFVQYWRSFEALRAYARDSDYLHLDAWREYNRSEANSEGAVGIWHETYLVRDGAYETVYNNVPPHGLGAADGTDLVPATGERESAAGRLGPTSGDDVPVPPTDSE